MPIELLSVNERIIESAGIRSGKVFSDITDDLYDKLVKFLRRFPTKTRFVNGKKVTTFDPDVTARKLLASMKREFAGLVTEAQFNEFMGGLLPDFDKLGENIKAVHGDENGISVAQSLVNDTKGRIITELGDSLFGAGYDARFADPVKKVLFSHVNFGATVTEAEAALRALVYGVEGTSAGLMSQYAGQVARDALAQYQGRVNREIQLEHGLTTIRYVGNIIANSRWQCRRWVDMEFIPEEQLQAEIRMAFRRGKGMIPGTTPSTFTIFRGGYNCMHTAFPTRRTK